MGKKQLKMHKVSFQDDNVEFGWYVVVTQFNWERKAAEHIQKRFESMGASDKFGEIIVPIIDFTEVNAKGKKVTKSKNIYDSGYIFIRMILTNDTWNIVRQTTGVAGWLNADGRPSPVSYDDIINLKEQLGLNTVEVVEFDGSIGDLVQITHGAMSGIEGNVAEISENKELLKVTVPIGTIEVSASQVKVV